MVGEVAEQPAADRPHDEAEREEDRGVELLDDRVAAGEERAGEIEREGRVGVEVVPLDEVADRADEDRRRAGAARRPVAEAHRAVATLVMTPSPRRDSCGCAPRSRRCRRPPTRDSDRTSTRLPFGLRRHADDDVVLESEPERRVGRLDASAGGIRRDQIPAHRPRRGERAIEGAVRRQVSVSGTMSGTPAAAWRRPRGRRTRPGSPRRSRSGRTAMNGGGCSVSVVMS